MLHSDLAIMHKGRPGHNKAEITALIGDVNGKICIVNDDMIDTAGTLCAAVATLKQKGAEKVYVCATHPVSRKESHHPPQEAHSGRDSR